MARQRKTASTTGSVKAPRVTIKQRKTESKRDYQNRVKQWKKTSKKWQEYEKAKRREANKKYYEKNKAKIKETRQKRQNRADYYAENIIGAKGWGKASKKERERYASNINKLKEAFGLLGVSFEKELYKEFGKLINNMNSKSSSNNLSELNDKLENYLDYVLKQKDELTKQIDDWDAVQNWKDYLNGKDTEEYINWDDWEEL